MVSVAVSVATDSAFFASSISSLSKRRRTFDWFIWRSIESGIGSGLP